MKKILLIIFLSILFIYSNSFAQNCDPNKYNDGMMVKEYEIEWNYNAEDAYNFGKKIQQILLDKNLKEFIDLTSGDLRMSLEKKYNENKSFEYFFDQEKYEKIINGEVYCFPLGSINTLQFWIGFEELVYTKKTNDNWVILSY
jgi:hypothetical protein